MNNYLIILKSDNGTVKIKTSANDISIAKMLVCQAENAPLSAVKKAIDLKFYNRDGSLNAYGLACGYVERKETATQWKELYYESDHFHVRKGPINGKFEVWENFSHGELTQARKLYRSL